MTVTDIRKDLDSCTMTIETAFDAPVDRVWELWADPRQLERWWGPPSHPATVTDHDLTPGGRVSYYMTGPDGEQYKGWWRVIEVAAPHRLELEDGFADDEGAPDPDLPTNITRVTLAERAEGGTRMTLESIYGSVEAMEQVLAMGMEEGIREALGQIDDILGSEVASQ